MIRLFVAIFLLYLFGPPLCTNSSTFGQQAYDARDQLLLPEFKHGAPRYCLLTFPAGNGDRRTVLAIADGDRLYIDKNSDGDLSAPDECILSTRKDWQSKRDHEFKVGEIEIGGRVHKDFQLSIVPLENFDRGDPRIKKLLETEPDADCFMLRIEIQDDRFQGAGADGRVIVAAGFDDIDGLLQFGKDLESAPTIKFSGELEIRLFAETKLRPGAEAEITTCVGTPGVGPGTFASIGYEGVIPEYACPRVSLQVNADEIGKLETTTYELSHRC